MPANDISIEKADGPAPKLEQPHEQPYDEREPGATRRFPAYADPRGLLVPVDLDALAFAPVRVFVVAGPSAGATRGGHPAPCREQVVLVSGRVAVRHGVSRAGNDHIHIAVNLVREDGTKASVWRHCWATST